MHPTKITNLFSEPSLYPAADSKSHETPYTFSESYHNRGTEDIWILTSQNLPVNIKGSGSPQGGPRSNEFVIRRSHVFRGSDTISTTKREIEKRLEIAKDKGHLNDSGKALYSDLLLMHSALTGCLKNNPQANKAEIHIDRTHQISKIRDLGKIYCLDSNIVIFHNIPQETLIHPNSHLHVNMSHAATAHSYPDSLYLNMVLIDKNHSLKKRFAAFGKKVLEIPVRHDDMLEDGLHITLKQGNDPVEQKIIPLDQLEKEGLFSSQEEAYSSFSHEDRVRLLEQQKLVNELKLKCEQSRLEAEALKADNEIARIEIQNQIESATIEHKKKIAELELQKQQSQIDFQTRENEIKKQHQIETNRLKEEKENIANQALQDKLKTENLFKSIAAHRENYYDKVSHERRDTSEVIKYGLPIVAGLVGGFMLRDKFN